MTKEELERLLDMHSTVSVQLHERVMEVKSNGGNRFKDDEWRQIRAKRQRIRDTILNTFDGLNLKEACIDSRNEDMLEAFKTLVSYLTPEELEEGYQRALYESRDSYILDDQDN